LELDVQRDARAEEFRQQEIMRAEKRKEEVERREELERPRQPEKNNLREKPIAEEMIWKERKVERRVRLLGLK
jgi:hypothetical protein